MLRKADATDRCVDGKNGPPDMAILVDVGQVATLLRCSERHVRRLARTGKMPTPIKLGSLVRWSRNAIDEWIARGCPPVPSSVLRGRST